MPCKCNIIAQQTLSDKSLDDCSQRLITIWQACLAGYISEVKCWHHFRRPLLIKPSINRNIATAQMFSILFNLVWQHQIYCSVFKNVDSTPLIWNYEVTVQLSWLAKSVTWLNATERVLYLLKTRLKAQSSKIKNQRWLAGLTEHPQGRYQVSAA